MPRRSVRLLLIVLLGLDAALILLHVQACRFPARFSPDCLLNQDGGHAEWLQYLEETLIAGLFAVIAWRRRNWRYAAWSAFFIAVVFDDALRFHERFGSWAELRYGQATWLGLPFYDLAQAGILGVAGLLCLSFVILSTRNADEEYQEVTCSLVGWLAILAVFAVGLDLANGIVGDGAISSLAEEAGELLGLTALTVYVTHLETSLRRPAGPPLQM